MIIITGAAGFIGSCLVRELNRLGIYELVLVDDFVSTRASKKINNLQGKKWATQVQREQLFDWLKKKNPHIEMVFHLGARTDTTEQNWQLLETLNLNYSKQLWQWCAEKGVPFLYASSAATYGDGSHGYSDHHSHLPQLQPLNPYARSKHLFDLWALQQKLQPPHWWGIKFFNVFGPNEYHKEHMASVVFHGYHQIRKTGKIRLFKSHRPDCPHGEQQRDFIYIKDTLNIILFFWIRRPPSGIYNAGTGQPHSFNQLAHALFKAMKIPPQIEYFDMPQHLRNQYQYYTCANISKLQQAGYTHPFTSLEVAVLDYVRCFLDHNMRTY